MKTTKLIKELQDIVDKHQQDFDIKVIGPFNIPFNLEIELRDNTIMFRTL